MAKPVNIPHARPYMGAEEIEAVRQVLESGWLTGGPMVPQFEAAMAKYLGRKYAVAVSSCTAALHLALLACKVGRGDEVITTPLSWIATANAILYCGATPVFVDVEPGTFNLFPPLIEEAMTARTAAILPVHLYGHPCDMHDVWRISIDSKCPIVGDCAHAVEADYRGHKVTGIGFIDCLSFWGTKNLSTGEGGMCITDSAEAAETLRELRSFGLWGGGRQSSGQYVQVTLGYKYTMSDIQAALGLVQLKRLEGRHALRVQAASRYDTMLKGVERIRTLARRDYVRSALHLYPVLVDEDRDGLVVEMRRRGIGVGIHYRPIHLEPYYRQRLSYKEGDFPVAEDAGRRVMTLPFWPEITPDQQEIVVKNLKECL